MIKNLRIAVSSRAIASLLCMSVGLCAVQKTAAQTTLPLNDLSAFKEPGKSWSIAGDVWADLSKVNTLNTGKGAGILVNSSTPKDKGTDIYSLNEHGDIDLEFDYMLGKGSNSGVYLQGRYEIQLIDYWPSMTTKSGDNAGIYHRWDESRPQGQKGYEGYGPRQNVSKAPGLWQHLKISFQAPRFDAQGQKTENAKIIRAELNGVLIHEDVELSGPTRGAMSATEVAKGPLRIQGDHGSVAFRNIKFTEFNKPRPELSNIKYTVYKGRYFDTLNISKLPPEAKGPLGNLTAGAINNLPSEYFINYSGTVKITEPGQYNFNMMVPGGRGILKINNKAVGPRGAIALPAGELPFELLYAKNQDWANRSLSMMVAGPGIREFVLGDPVSGGNSSDPIYLDATSNTMLRSFMDIPGGTRVVHAISVGSPQGVHYTFDLDKGSLVQVWRGGFLDATPMWYSRGDGSSRPRGAVQHFGKPVFTIEPMATADAAWVTDTVGSNYIPKGYKLDKNDLPTFQYSLFGAMVEDAITPLVNGEGLQRVIRVKNPAQNLYIRLGEGKEVTEVSNGLFAMDDKAYYIRLDAGGTAKPVVRTTAGGRKELLLPLQNELTYSILF